MVKKLEKIGVNFFFFFFFFFCGRGRMGSQSEPKHTTTLQLNHCYVTDNS